MNRSLEIARIAVYACTGSDLTSTARYTLRYRVRKDKSFIDDVNYRTRSILTKSIQPARTVIERRRLIRVIDRYSSIELEKKHNLKKRERNEG